MEEYPFRSEVRDFIQVSEALLSSNLRDSILSLEECDLISMYVIRLCQEKNPWSKSLLLRCALEQALPYI